MFVKAGPEVCAGEAVFAFFSHRFFFLPQFFPFAGSPRSTCHLLVNDNGTPHRHFFGVLPVNAAGWAAMGGDQARHLSTRRRLSMRGRHKL